MRRSSLPQSPPKLTWQIGLPLLLALVLLIYSPAVRGGFVWDDDAFLTNNPLIKADDGLSRFWFSTEPPDYFPLTSSTLWFEWRLWGMNATGYHVVNCLLHVLSTVLIWLILKQLKIPGAWLAALIFAIHPVNVEAVAWITQRKSTLPLVFYGLSIWSFLNYEQQGRRLDYTLALVAFVLAMLSKTSVVMLPFVLLSCAWWQRRRITREDLRRILPFFILAFALSLVTIWFQYNRSIGDDIVRTDSFLARLAGVGWVVWFYIYKVFIPVNLAFVYPRWEIDAGRLLSWVPNLALLGAFALCWWQRARWGRACLFAFGYFIVTLFPMLGFFNIYYFRYSLVADHYQYQSIIGIIALVVAAGYLCYSRAAAAWHVPIRAGAGLVVVLLAVQTFVQAGIYKDLETILLDTVAKNPRSWMPYYNLGHLKQNEKKYDEAVRYYTNGIGIQPDNPDPHNNLGNLYLETGQYDKALDHFRQALALRPDFAETHYNLGTALMELHRYPEAIDHFYRALATMRGVDRIARVHNNLANALATVGRNHQALVHYREALRLRPAFVEARNNMDIVLKRLKKSRNPS